MTAQMDDEIRQIRVDCDNQTESHASAFILLLFFSGFFRFLIFFFPHFSTVALLITLRNG